MLLSSPVHCHFLPRMKRVVMAACLAVLLMVVAVPASASPIVSVVPSSSNVTVGGVFSVDFLISGVSDLYAFQFGIAFDPTILTAFTVTQGAFLSTAGSTVFNPGFIDNNLGFISFNAGSLVGPIGGASGSGTLLSVTFGAFAFGTSAISAVFDPLQLDDLLDSSLTSMLIDPTTGAYVPPSVVNGNVTIAPRSVPESSTLLILAMGLATCGVARWQQRRRASLVKL